MPPLLKKLQRQQQLGLLRTRTPLTQRDNAYSYCAGKRYLAFIHFDYLGLATHPEVIQALQQAATTLGISSSASQLLGGHYEIHQQLEHALATFTGYECALVFPTGYMANLAVLTSLLSSEDCILLDRLSHASLLDAARFSTATLKRYQHRDMASLELLLQQSSPKSTWIGSDGVFSMEGDIAPLPQLLALAKQYQCSVIIDDAHGIGVLGQQGRGSLEHHRIDTQNISVLVGTFGKAFGTMGAFIAGSNLLIETLLQFGRSYIYTTALPPAIASATLTSLQILQRDTWRREHLQQLIQHFSHGAKALNLPILPSVTPIQSIIIGDAHKTMALAQQLQQHGILVGAIRPPTVPINTARLRINICVQHTPADIDFLLEKLSLTLR